MTVPEHDHAFRPAIITLPDGPVEGGRCSCGVEVVGPASAPFRLNADVLRACQTLHAAMVDALVTLARSLRR